jgi:NADH-quinone oxidoreductase subunit E
MLSEQEKLEIDEIVRHVFTKRASCIEALKVVQKHRRWISDESLEDVARNLDMTTAEIESVATYYNLLFRKPVGEHVILACDSISCFLTGGESVMDHLKHRLGIEPGLTTPDERFTLLPTSCLGHCEQGPAMMIDGKIVGNLTEEKIDRILSDIDRENS